MTHADFIELHDLADLARRRAAGARNLAAARRRRAADALAGRQMAYAQGLLDSASWLEAAAQVEDLRAAQLEQRRAVLQKPAACACGGR